MNYYIVGGQECAVIEGELWVKAPSAATPPIPVEREAKPKRKYKTGQVITSTKHNRLEISDEVKDQIRERFSKGASRKELMQEFGLSYPTIAKYCRLKPMSARTKGKEVQDYICVSGHEFRSKLPPGNVMCPTCHSRDCDLGTLDGPVKDADDLEN